MNSPSFGQLASVLRQRKLNLCGPKIATEKQLIRLSRLSTLVWALRVFWFSGQDGMMG